MKNTISILTIAFLAFGAMTSCNTTEENEAPTVTIMSPLSSGNPYMSGSTIMLHVEATDDDELHEVAVSIVREHDNTEVYHSHAHPDANTYTLHEDTVFTTTEHSNFIITATASDHDGEEVTATETIHMHPM